MPLVQRHFFIPVLLESFHEKYFVRLYRAARERPGLQQRIAFFKRVLVK
jgi:hypothetical protein